MKPRIRSANPIFPVADVEATVEWYERNLRASNVWKYGDPVGHAGCTLGSSQLQFSREPQNAERAKRLELFVFVANVQELCDEYRERGIEIAEELERKPWGATEFVVVDPNSVRLRFAEFRDKPKAKPELEGVEYIVRKLTAEEHRALYRAVGWSDFYSKALSAETLAASALVTVVAALEGRTIGAASVCGNGVEIFVVRDVIVLPDFQGRGVGRLLMTELMKWVEENVPKGAQLTLQTGTGTTEFYEEFGFIGPDKGLIGMYKPA